MRLLFKVFFPQPTIILLGLIITWKNVFRMKSLVLQLVKSMLLIIKCIILLN